jgi:hypothetical protein
MSPTTPQTTQQRQADLAALRQELEELVSRAKRGDGTPQDQRSISACTPAGTKRSR